MIKMPFMGLQTILLTTVTCFASTPSKSLFSDTFDSGSLTDPSARATGSLASEVKYAFTENSNHANVSIVSGKLSWTGKKISNGDLESSNGTQNWTFVDVNGDVYDWSKSLAGKIYEIRFTYHSAWSHPLTFGLSDDVQYGNWNADEVADYDFAFGAYGANWQSGVDGSTYNTSGSEGNKTYEVSIRIDETEGTVVVYINDVFVVADYIDFEKPGRYLTFGEPTRFGGFIDNFTVIVVDNTNSE